MGCEDVLQLSGQDEPLSHNGVPTRRWVLIINVQFIRCHHDTLDENVLLRCRLFDPT